MSVPSGKCHAVTSGVLLAQCYSLDSLADDRHVRCWVMDACPCKLVPLSARVLCHMDDSDTIIYVSQKAQTVPGQVRWHPWEYRA